MAKNKKTNVPLLLGVCAIVLSVALLGILAATGVLPIETTIDGVHTGIASGLRHFFACFVYDPGLIGDGGPIWWAETMSVGGTLGMFATIVEFFLLIAGIVVLVKNGNKGKIWSAVTLLIALFATNAIGSIFLNGMVYEVLWRSASFWYGLSLLILVLGAAALVYDLWPAIFADAEEDEEDEDMIPVFDEYACRKIVQEQIQKLRDAAPSVVTKEKADEIVERAIEEHVAKLHAEPSEEIQAEDPKASPFDGFGDTKRVPFVEKLEAADEDLKNKYQELHDYVLSYGIKSRISIPGDTFAAHRERYVFLTVAGKHIKAYFALNPEDYVETKIPVETVTTKKFEDLPCCLKIRSDLSLRRAFKLVDDVMAAKGVTKEN